MQRNVLQRQLETGRDQMHFGPGQSSYNPDLTGAASQRNLAQRQYETGRAQTQFMNGAQASSSQDSGTAGQEKARDRSGPELGG